MSIGVRVRVSSMVPKGQIIVMPDYFGHPEVGMFDFAWGPNGLEAREAEVPDGRLIYCHAKDEERVRDAIAVAQERPQWWEDWRRFEMALQQMMDAAP